ncbi:TPA: ATP-binding protein [Enterococcus faecium]|nr:ATP-binding protein [Enterococcus faecium]
MDNNLVWNKDNEVFAYYELIPYNYSFLSAEQKFIVHDSFRQLIAQSREGKIHALQIATESSIRSQQEQSKKLVTGKLKEVAYQKIDEQTEALVSMIGDNQVDYRFFLGFKLMVTEEQLNLKNIKKSAWLTFTEFLHEVNHTLMNDFVSMPNDEINRYMKMEKLLENKISRRFKVRRLEINDFGYLMEHLYGRDGIAYEDYEYQLPKKKLQKETLMKYYDLIRPTRCVIEESQRYLRLEHEDKESYVSYFTVNAIVGELDFPSSEIFYFQQQQFTFPVDTSMNVEIVENRKALTTVRNKKKELKDLDNHAYQAGSETSSNVVDALDSVDELETDLDQTKESMYKLSYVIRVSAPDLDELKRRCDEVKDFYDDLNVKLVRPAGDMLGLHSEFLPASKRYINDYVQYVKSDFLAGLGFGATQQLGENTGIYIGYSVDTGRNVYLQPSLASQGVKGTVTNALASAFVGSLGGGKSFCNNLLVYYSVLFGGQAVILDPKSERGNWKETLPEIAHEINIVNLTSDKDNAGLLDPFVIMKNVKDAESLAIDILTFLTGISSRDGEKFPVLRKAVRSVTQSDSRGLLHVIDELRREDTPISRNIADHIDSFTDYDFAHLLFSDGTVENAISLDNQLNIIQVADLVLPDKDTTFEEYTTIELLSVSMLIVISTFALDFIHSDRSIFKIVDLDEAWAFLNVAQGETLSNKLVRAGRAMQAGVYFVTQSAYDVSKESLKNNIGLKFAFRSTDINEIKQTLEFFGIDKDDENNQKRLRDLENGQCLLQDLYGRVGVVQIHPVFEELLHAFDTRPPVQRNEVE